MTLYRGVLDFARSVPDRDIAMIAPVAALVADHDLHPALVDVLAEAALEIHSQDDLFAEPREFPAAAHPQIPTIRGAREYLQHGPSYLQRRLPIWAASLVERSILILIPLLTLVLPLTRALPRVIEWHIRSRAFRWYRELRAIEREAAQLTPIDTAMRCRFLARRFRAACCSPGLILGLGAAEARDRSSPPPAPWRAARLRPAQRRHV